MKAEQESLNKNKVDTVNFPTTNDCGFAEQFLRWITSNAGGGRGGGGLGQKLMVNKLFQEH